MVKNIILNSHPWETRAAVTDNGILTELYIERPKGLGVSGNIYKGKVERVLPGMEAAFVDIGLMKSAFLYVNDFYDDFYELEGLVGRGVVNGDDDRKEKIFGYNLVLSTSVQVQLKIELPVAATNIAGNAEEGSQIIHNKEQVHNYHQAGVRIDIADAKYDIIHNYEYIREKGSIPVIDYNRRNEDLSKTAMISRGYDQNGWPFAPCGLLCRPNGFDQKYQRLTFCCFNQCMKLKKAALQRLLEHYDMTHCPHVHNRTGFSRHMYAKEHPRLVNEIPRGSKRYNVIKRLRSASERANSTIKEDIKILEKPRIISGFRANILAQMAGITLLLKRAFAFIVKVTNRFIKSIQTDDPRIKEKLKPPFIPKSIRNIIQVE